MRYQIGKFQTQGLQVERSSYSTPNSHGNGATRHLNCRIAKYGLYFQKHQKQNKNKENGKWKLQKNY